MGREGKERKWRREGGEGREETRGREGGKEGKGGRMPISPPRSLNSPQCRGE
jgi:hypothetical protein